MEKKGSEKYYIIISLILGLILVAIVLYFLFHEYFTSEDINWQTCKQSILVRAGLPEEDLVNMISTKGGFDLKCRTQVIDIDYKDKEKFEKEIAEALASSWNLVGKGTYRIFPTAKPFGKGSPCMVFYRIHIDDSVKDFYTGENEISYKNALNYKMDNGVSYGDYINDPVTPGFKYFKGWKENFDIHYNWYATSPPDKFTDANDAGFYFPEKHDINAGDLFIIFAQPIRSEKVVHPYLFFLQEKDFNKLNEEWIGYNSLYSGYLDSIKVEVCSSIETIPA